MKRVLLLLVFMTLMSCTAEPIEVTPKPIGMTKEQVLEANKPTFSTFTFKWASNQEGAYVELSKLQFKDCKLTTISTEIHQENRFEVTFQDGQPFDIQIKREHSVNRPELYLAIYKGDVLQYEQEVNTNGFGLSTFVDNEGNIVDTE